MDNLLLGHQRKLRVMSINLNGIRSASSKGFFQWMQTTDADIICVQELKAQLSDLTAEVRNPAGYRGYFHYARKKGYSGVGIYHRCNLTLTPVRNEDYVSLGMEVVGRYIRADFGECLSVISIYVPSGTSGAEKQKEKFIFLDTLLHIMQDLQKEKRELIICGDWNIAHDIIDLKNWKSNQRNSGFLPEERRWLTSLYRSGWVDVYRKLYPEVCEESYTWWSNRGNAYTRNIGWRIDLHIATTRIASSAIAAFVYKAERFSDHAPLIIDYDIASFHCLEKLV